MSSFGPKNQRIFFKDFCPCLQKEVVESKKWINIFIIILNNYESAFIFLIQPLFRGLEQKFRWFIGLNDDTKKSFWNELILDKYL